MTKNAPFILLIAVLTVGLHHTPAYSGDEEDKAASGVKFLEEGGEGSVRGSGGGVYAEDADGSKFDGIEYTEKEKKEHAKPPELSLLSAEEKRKEDLKKGLKKAAATGKGAVYGGVIGAVVGGVLGSVVPGLGTAAGVVVGGTAGAAVGAFLGYMFGGKD